MPTAATTLAKRSGCLQTELQSKDKAVADLRLWLDQAQGQLQNTQEALNQREGECCQLEADLTQAQAALEAAQASCTSSHLGLAARLLAASGCCGCQTIRPCME